jgi:hypothetical protein
VVEKVIGELFFGRFLEHRVGYAESSGFWRKCLALCDNIFKLGITDPALFGGNCPLQKLVSIFHDLLSASCDMFSNPLTRIPTPQSIIPRS